MSDRAGSPAAVLGATLAGRYRVVQLLRTGGIADVYLAEAMTPRPAPDGARGPDLARTGKPARFALKVLRHEFANDRAVIRRFERGAVAAARVVHPNVVRVGPMERQPDGLPFCTMELLIGLDLADTLAYARRLDPRRAMRVAEGVAAGLAAAHAAGVVHLDVKPENVFLVHQPDGRELVKLLDFGLASLPGDARVDSACSTPEYMAPEQQRGAPATPAMDVYALGATLLEMLTGHPPSATSAPWPGAPPSTDVPPRLARVLDRALARDPEARFPSMTDFRAALLAALEDAPPPSARAAG